MDLGGNTPLHLAARQGNTTTASTLLNLGASVNMKVRSNKMLNIYFLTSLDKPGNLFIYKTVCVPVVDWMMNQCRNHRLFYCST